MRLSRTKQLLVLNHHHLDCSRYAGEGHCDNEIAPTSLKLNIQLELLSWKNVIDVTGDKKILKKITKMGEGFDRPNEGSLVKGNFKIFMICIF